MPPRRAVAAVATKSKTTTMTSKKKSTVVVTTKATKSQSRKKRTRGKRGDSDDDDDDKEEDDEVEEVTGGSAMAMESDDEESSASTHKQRIKKKTKREEVTSIPSASTAAAVTTQSTLTFWPHQVNKKSHGYDNNSNSSDSNNSSSSTTINDSNDNDIRQRFARFVLNPKKNHNNNNNKNNNNNNIRTIDKSRITFWPQTNSITTRIAQDLPILRVRSISPDLISATYHSIPAGAHLPLPLTPKQKRLTRKEIQRFIKEVEHPLRYLGQSIPLQSAYDELQSIFLEVTPLPNDLISLIREYRLEVLPSQPLIISPEFGPNRGSSPFNTAAIEISSQDNFDEREPVLLDDDAYLACWIGQNLGLPLDRRPLEARLMRGPIMTESETAAAVKALLMKNSPMFQSLAVPAQTVRPPIDVIRSLPSLTYSGYTIRQIVGYDDTSHSAPNRASCIGVKFVYGPQIDPPETNRPNRIPTRDLVEQVGVANSSFVMPLEYYPLNRDVLGGSFRCCRYTSMRLELDEYITRVTFRVGRQGLPSTLTFDTNYDRHFTIGRYWYPSPQYIKFEYTITTPPGHALIALTGTEHKTRSWMTERKTISSIRGVYAAISIRKPTKQQPNEHSEEKGTCFGKQ